MQYKLCLDRSGFNVYLKKNRITFNTVFNLNFNNLSIFFERSVFVMSSNNQYRCRIGKLKGFISSLNFTINFQQMMCSFVEKISLSYLTSSVGKYIYSNKKDTPYFHGTVSFHLVKMSQQK